MEEPDPLNQGYQTRGVLGTGVDLEGKGHETKKGLLTALSPTDRQTEARACCYQPFGPQNRATAATIGEMGFSHSRILWAFTQRKEAGLGEWGQQRA